MPEVRSVNSSVITNHVEEQQNIDDGMEVDSTKTPDDTLGTSNAQVKKHRIRK